VGGVKGFFSRAAFGVLSAAVLTVCLAPIAWQALTALKPDAQLTKVPIAWWPSPPTLEHVRTLWDRKPVASLLLNSLGVATASTLLAVAFGALAAAALAGMERRSSRRVLFALLFLSAFPPILLLFPLYEGVRALGLLNDPLALVVPYVALNLPLAVFLLERGLRQIPPALGEAAALDGLTPFQTLARIQLPLALPHLVSAGLLVFIACWNEFMLALSFATREERKTVTAGIATLTGASMFDIPWGQLAAGVLLATLPLVALVVLFERRLASALVSTSTKG
jgi:multiple sugar transport system permease protein